MKTDLVKALIQRRDYLLRIISEKEKSLQNLPPKGRLRCSVHRGKAQFYCVTSRGDPTGKYIHKKDRGLAVALAQKEYDQKVLKYAASELSTINILLRKHDSADVDSIYEALHEMRKELVCPISPTDEEFLENWLSRPYPKKGFPENYPNFTTIRGERVRSKSEILIANTLWHRKIPYCFEYPLRLSRLGTVHPDFSVLNLRLRKTFYWEHLGRMDDPDYVNTFIRRYDAYMQDNIFVGEKLLLTWESKDNPLEPEKVDQLIDHYLV